MWLSVNSHPNHVKREIGRCRYQGLRKVIITSENLKEEQKHLQKVLQSRDYNSSAIRAGSKH